MISPLTRTTMRSRRSAPPRLVSSSVAASRARRLRRCSLLGGFMVHLCPGQEAPDEFSDACLRLLQHEALPDLLLRFLSAGQPRLLARVQPQDVVAQRALHDLARLAGRQIEHGFLELARELSPRERAHEAPRTRLRRPRPGLGQGLELLGVLLQAAPDVPGLVGRRHYYL